MNDKLHPFTKTLGPGPYAFLGIIEIKFSPTFGAKVVGDVGLNPERGVGTCAHCGHAIVSCYVVETGERRRFAVGSDCIHKAFMEYNGRLPTAFERARLALNRQKRSEAKLRKLERDLEFLRDQVATRATEFESMKHPSRSDKTLLDYLSFCIEKRSISNAIKLIKRLNAA